MAKITEKSVDQKIAEMKQKFVIDTEDLEGPSDGPVDDVMKIVVPMMNDMLGLIDALHAELKERGSL